MILKDFFTRMSININREIITVWEENTNTEIRERKTVEKIEIRKQNE
jgi:hypothetical protein